jgi:hypothetical protein
MVSVAQLLRDGSVVLRGDVIGIATATGEGRRRTRTLAAGTGFAVDSAVGRVVDASLFRAGDVLETEDGTDIGTVQSVDETTNPDSVTLVANAAVAVAAGAVVRCADGSAVAKGISDDETDGGEDTSVSLIIAAPALSEAKLRGLDDSALAELGGARVGVGIVKL